MIEFIFEGKDTPDLLSFGPSSIRYNLKKMWILKILIEAHTQPLAEKTALISFLSGDLL